MNIQKYTALIQGTDRKVTGYITETRDYLGGGSYGDGTEYLISVTSKSMPGGPYGTYKATKESIEAV